VSKKLVRELFSSTAWACDALGDSLYCGL